MRSAIEERFGKAWLDGTDELLTKLGAAAAQIVLEERPTEEERAAAAARRHVRAIQTVRVHLKSELQMWFKSHGPERAVALARENMKESD
jgi:hypothetical protein